MTVTGPEERTEAPGQAVVDAALLLLERMGLEPAGHTARTGTACWASGVPGGWTSRPHRTSAT